jgi:hypothetical protein
MKPWIRLKVPSRTPDDSALLANKMGAKANEVLLRLGLR